MILTKFKLQAVVVTGALLVFSGGAWAESESVLVKRPAQLRDAPGDQAGSLASLAVQTPLTRLGERRGAWIRVRTADGASGWVHMFDVGSATAPVAGNAGANALRSITGFFNKGSAAPVVATGPISTVGIRGLGAEDLANAQPNLLAVTLADSARLDATQARQFANSASLVAQNVAPLPVPASRSWSPPAGTAPNGSQPNNDLFRN
ncbi:MAG: SH3 domain-containing protein [Polaromonas sp.]|nr:SH3 domain-containing protein [Polaromonas sp.]